MIVCRVRFTHQLQQMLSLLMVRGTHPTFDTNLQHYKNRRVTNNT